MKKLIIYTLLSAALFAGCKKDNDNLIEGKNPEERVSEALNKYNATLKGSANGWKAYLYPNGGGGYSFYLNFMEKNRVSMYADLDYAPAEESFESSYRLKGNQVPSLLFDTYSYMHILADPDPSTFGGTSGWGLYSDFEFDFVRESGDTLFMKGKMLESDLILIKATKEEADSYNSKGLLSSVATGTQYFDENLYLYVNLGDDIKVQTSFDYYNKVVSLTWEEAGEVSTVSTPFAFTLKGLELKEPLEYKGKFISGFTWDAAKQEYVANTAAAPVTVMSSATPILPLHSLIGVNYSDIIVPNGTAFPGWSSDFQARRAAAAASMLAGPYRLRLDRMIFTFNTIQKSMTITTEIYQGATGFTGAFPYSYNKTNAGVYKFTARAATGNGSLIVADMAPLTTQRISADDFTLDYFVNPTNGQILGQFKSVQHPDFFFSGTLQ